MSNLQCVECRKVRFARERSGDLTLHIACSGAEADACPQGHTGEKMERRVVACCAMDLVVWRAVDTQLTLCVWEPVHVSNALAGVIPSKDDHGELDGMYTEGGAQSRAEKKAS